MPYIQGEGERGNGEGGMGEEKAVIPMFDIYFQSCEEQLDVFNISLCRNQAEMDVSIKQ